MLITAQLVWLVMSLWGTRQGILLGLAVDVGPVGPEKQGNLSTQDLQQLEQQVFALANQERRKVGKRPLLWDEVLAQAARFHSQNMGERNFFSHEDPRLGGIGQRLQRFRIPWSLCGENIYMIQGTDSEKDLSAIARKAISRWMSSPGHRANILNNSFTYLGVGAYYDPQSGAYYLTQVFICPPRDEKRSWWQTLISRIFPRKSRQGN